MSPQFGSTPAASSGICVCCRGAGPRGGRLTS